MTGHTYRDRTSDGDTSADLSAQLAEHLTAFDEIALYGRERYSSQASTTTNQVSAKSYLDRRPRL